MSKVIKILVSMLSTVILTLIILPVLVSLLLNLPSVQDYAVQRAMTILSKKLETKVTIDRIDLRLFNRVVLDGLYVEDYQRDTLLYVGSLGVEVGQFGVFKGNMELGTVRLSDAKFYLRQCEDGSLNLKQLIQRLKSNKSKDKKSEFRMSVARLDISDLKFKYRKLLTKNRDFGIDFSDLEVDDFALSGTNISIIDDSISLKINNISLRESCGFVLNGLAASAFNISGTGMRFSRLMINTPESRLETDYLNMLYDRWASYKDFITQVRIESRIVNSSVAFGTIAYFAPSLKSWETKFNGLNAVIDGTVDSLSGRVSSAHTRSTDIDVSFGLYGVPDIQNTRFMFEVHSLRTVPEDIDFIVSDITGKDVIKRQRWITKLGNVGLTGNFDGLLSKFNADAELTTSLGDANMNMGFVPANSGQTAFKGSLDVIEFDLGTMTDNKKLGRATLSAQMDGKFGAGMFNVSTEATMPKVEFNGYAYNSILMSGLINNRTFHGYIGSSDPNIMFDFNGMLDFNDSIPQYDFDLKLHRADLNKLNFNKRDSVSVVSCGVLAHASGSTLDNVNGWATVDDMIYVNHIDSVHTGQIRLVGENSEHSKLLGLYSSFADVEFKSRLSYRHLFDYLQNTMVTYIPTLSSSKSDAVSETMSNSKMAAADINSYSIVRMNVKEANNVAGIFLPGLQFAEGTNLLFMFNPDAGQVSLTLKSNYIEQGGFFVSQLDMNTRNQGDSLSLFLRADDLYIGGVYMPNLSIIGGAKRNKVNMSARFFDNEKRTRALLGVTSKFVKDSISGMPQLVARVTPSIYTHNNQQWQIASRDIVCDSTMVKVNNFRIVSDNQVLVVDGVASKSREDTLRVRLSNFNLAPFSQLTDRAGYALSGYTTGNADIVSALEGGWLYSRISFDSLKINDVKAPPILFESTWDFYSERAKFVLRNRATNDKLLDGYYSPSDGRYMADIKLRDIDLSLLNPQLKGVIGDNSGRVDADLTLAGTKKEPEFNGTLRVHNMQTTVDFTKVRYSVPKATVSVNKNQFVLKPTLVYDPSGNSAEFEMTLGNRYFSNINYDIRIRPRNMLVINTSPADNDYFYGSIYATGAATIKGDKLGVSMDIAATTDDNSSFYMPLSGKSNISEADFVVFDSPNRAKVDSTNILVRKKMMFDRRNKPKSTFKSKFDINLAINVRPNTDFQLVIDPTVGDIIKGRGNGTLNLHINPRDNEFTMYGDYEITEGSYLFTLQNIINKRFIIQPGSVIKWTGEPVDALLDITAIYKLKASLAPLLSSNDENFRRSVPVECQIKLGERLSQPSIMFDVSVQNVDPETRSLVANQLNTQEMMATQFFWLLAVNSFYADNTGTNQSVNIGAMGSSATAFEFLSNQLSNWISSDKYNIGIRYRPKSDMTSDEFDIGFSTDLVENRLLLEIEGNYDFGNNAAMSRTGTSNLTGDFYLTWLIDRAGNLKAKGFTRTIDRFDENQGLQESGLGIYYKEDFNNFSDIIRNIRARFKGKRSEIKPLPADSTDN